MNVVVLTNDLMFGSQLGPAIATTGLELQSCLSADAAIEHGRSSDTHAIVLDLNMPGVDLADLQQKLQENQSDARLIAVGPHVHKNKLDAAKVAGWEVFTRGQFHADTAAILMRAR